MNKKMQYMAMLEIPLNSVNITTKSVKKRKKRVKKVDDESVKNQLIDKINLNTVQESMSQTDELYNEPSVYNGEQLTEDGEQENYQLPAMVDGTAETSVDSVSIKPVKKKSFLKPTLVGVQLMIIGVLVGVIFLTSALNTNSGINVFFRSVFGGVQTVDARTHKDFNPQVNVDVDYLLDNGVVSFTESGSVYAWCDGTVTDVQFENGLYTVEITHSPNFKSVLKGLSHFYSEKDAKIYKNLPVGYCDGKDTTMTFIDSDGSVIVGYTIENNTVVWAV